MAIDKDIENESGVSVRYWRPTIINIDDLNGRMEVQMWGWKNQAARLAGKSHISIKTFIFDDVTFPNMKVSTTKAEIYTEVKKQTEFIDAVDC